MFARSVDFINDPFDYTQDFDGELSRTGHSELVESMKSTSDPRHLKRLKIIKYLFAASFSKKSTSHRSPFIKPIQNLISKIDPIIEESAPQFPIEKISKIDAAILRLAVYELLFIKKEPKKVIIDEAVEIAKEFGGEKSSSFINGVLGNVDRKYIQI